MQFQIRGQGLSLTQDDREYIADRSRDVLEPIVETVGSVGVQLTDLNGPKGGRDKRCRLMVRMVDGRTLVVHETDDCGLRAVDRALSRMRRQIGEQLRRRQDHRRYRHTIRRPYSHPIEVAEHLYGDYLEEDTDFSYEAGGLTRASRA